MNNQKEKLCKLATECYVNNLACHNVGNIGEKLGERWGSWFLIFFLTTVFESSLSEEKN